MARQTIELGFLGLSDARHPALTPPGYWREVENATFARGAIEGAPRPGPATSRAGGLPGDVALGFGIFRYGGVEETLAIVGPAGGSGANLYRIDAGGVWTLVETGLARSRWELTQYGDRVYAANPDSPLYRRLVGSLDAPARWEPAPTTLEYGGDLGASLERPEYPRRRFGGGDAATYWSLLGGFSARIDAGSGEVVIERGGPDTASDIGQRATVVLAAAIDLSAVDFVGFDVSMSNAKYTPGGGPNDNLFLTLSLSSDGGATWTDCATSGYDAIARLDDSRASDLSVRAAVPAFPGRGAVNAVRFQYESAVWPTLVVRISPLELGGADLTGIGASSYLAPKIEYAYRYESPDGAAGSAPVLSALGTGLAQGTNRRGDLGLMGARVRLGARANATFAAGGMTRIRYYRKGKADGAWRRIGDGANADDADGRAPFFVDASRERDLGSLASSALPAAGFPFGAQPRCAAVWKGHLALAVGRLLHLSRGGLPTSFLPPPEEDFAAPLASDLSQPRTMYLSPDRSEGAVAIAAGDVLYLAGERGIYAVVGDSALEATAPRPMPKGRPPLGPGAAAAYEGGVLVAARDGLWLLTAARAQDPASREAIYRAEELTAPVRSAWRRLGAETGPVAILDSLGELWVCRGNRYLRLTPPDAEGERRWEAGVFPAATFGAGVFGLAWSPSLGARAMLRDGRVARFAYDGAGDPYAGDLGGAPARWRVRTGRRPIGRGSVVALRIHADGAPTVRLRSYDGTPGTSGAGGGSAPRGTWEGTVEPGRRWMRGVDLAPGTEIEVEIEGACGADAAWRVELAVEDADPGYGE